MQKYGTEKKHLASVSVKNHANASLNPNAQYPYEITLEKALSAPIVSDPFTIFDSSPITDGAGAVILSSEGKDGDVYIAASESATDTLDLAKRDSLTEIKATKLASLKAYQKAGIKPSDIDVLEVHDCFTIAEILAMEDFRGEMDASAGYLSPNGLAVLPSMSIHTLLVCRYSRIASIPPSRPKPDLLNPPNGVM